MQTLMLLAAATFAQTLTDESFGKLRTTIRPSVRELKWMEVPWRPTFWAAVREAQATDKPVLLWAMNGHPLACT